MAVFELATLTDGTPHYTIRVQLEGTDYALTFRFSERRAAWSFDMVTLDGDEVLTGQLITCGRDFLRRNSSEFRPPGALWALNWSDNAGPTAIPGLYDLGAGGNARLYYTEKSTLDGEDQDDG